MKLKTRRKSSFPKRNKLLFVLFILAVFLFFPIVGFGQHFQFKFENTPVSNALAEVANKMQIRIAFDADKLKQFTVTKNISDDNPAGVISSILANTNYTTQYKYNTWLIVKSSRKLKGKPGSENLVAGIVFDKKTGERLPYASILLLDKNSSFSTNVDGNFSISLNDSASSHLCIKYLGYHALDTVFYPNTDARFFAVGLQQKLQTLQTVEITGEKLEMVDITQEAGHFSFNPTRFSDLPNYGETDVFRALQLLPGISSRENSSQLNIRGGSADQNLVMFDGFTLYNLDHFFGVFSALNPNVIKNIQVYKGGFDSRYGERVSGIVDITGKSGNKQKPEFYGGINLIAANLTAEIPVSEKLSLVAAGRRAYSDIYSTWLADALLADKTGQGRRFTNADNVIEPKFYFSDFNLKLTWTPNQKENISFSSYGAKDDLNSSILSQREQLIINTNDVNEWGNYGFGFSWKKQHSAKYFTNVQLGHSGYFNNYNNSTTISGELPNTNQQVEEGKRTTNEENNLVDYFVSFQNKYYLNHQNHLEFGISAKYMQFKFYKDASQDIVYNDLNSSASLYSLFFQDKINWTNKFSIKPGFRLNYYDKIGKLNVEPRLTASYKTENGLIFKMATGKYYQYLNKSGTEQSFGYNRNFWVLSDDDLHPVVSSNHFILGTSFKKKKLFFDIEAYYKSFDGLQEYLFFQNPETRQQGNPPDFKPELELSQFISGKGQAFGIDFLAKYENTNFTSWLAYSISKATHNFNEINNGENIPAQFDQTHEIKWTTIYTYGKWNFSTLTLFTTGHPYIEYAEKDDNFNTTRIYKRLPDYFRIDLSLNYNFNIKNVHINPGMSILNALNTENYLDIYTRRFDFQNNPISETTLVKAQKLTLNFFVNFRF